MKKFIKLLATSIWRLFFVITYLTTTVYCVLRIVMNIALSAKIGWNIATVSFEGFIPTAFETSLYVIIIILMWLIYGEMLKSWKRKDK